ncbi:MAG: hypothetical protein L0Y55_12240, partial [Anaerolineales bacterium]|nr:hypothetical protein [Anaerolineales bacterium]
MNDLMKYDYPQLTSPIFHYTSASGLMGILDSNTIWATNIFYLNDFAELVLAIKRVQEQIPHLQEHVSKEDCNFLDEFGKHLGEITQKFSVRLFDLS